MIILYINQQKLASFTKKCKKKKLRLLETFFCNWIFISCTFTDIKISFVTLIQMWKCKKLRTAKNRFLVQLKSYFMNVIKLIEVSVLHSIPDIYFLWLQLSTCIMYYSKYREKETYTIISSGAILRQIGSCRNQSNCTKRIKNSMVIYEICLFW